MSSLHSISVLNAKVSANQEGYPKAEMSKMDWIRFHRAHNLYYSGNRLVSSIDYAINHKLRYVGITEGVTRYYSS